MPPRTVSPYISGPHRMASSWRVPAIAAIVSLLSLSPVAVQAQALGQDFLRQGPGAQTLPPAQTLTTPSIGNPAGGRDTRGARPPAESRAPQPAEPEAPPERIEFQDFVAQSTGRDLPIFGADLFRNVPSTFAPVENIPVTADYVIGPGDEVMIRAWGQLEVDFNALVDRTGAINIPKVGSINVAGIRYQDLQAHLKTAIGRVFRNFDLSVSLGQLRAIQVFVVGQARRPGSYTVSSMSSLVNAVFASGGPSAKGSMRGIQLKRGNKVVTELDLYDLLIRGDKSKDARLLPGDVIYVPPVGPLVAISGSVNVPAIFELKDAATLADLIAWGGGLPGTASGQKATVERIDDHRVRRVEEFKLDAAGTRARLRNGDLVTIYSVTPRFDNAVTLRGNVAQPGRFPWREGMRVKDLIPRVEALLSRHYWLRKNQAVGLDNTVAALLRSNRAAGVDIPVTDLLKKSQPGGPEEAQSTVAEAMRRTQISADVVTANTESIKKLGAARATSTQSTPLGLGVGQGSLAAPELVEADRAGARLSDEIKRNLNEINWNYAVIERLDPKDLTTSLVPFNLGKAILESDPAQNLLLRPGDVVTIFSVDDIQVPIAHQTKYVRLEGEFRNPGIYSVEPGETLRQLVVRVGGLSPNAYLFGAELTRESTRVFQQKKLEETINRLEREMQRSSITRGRNISSAEEAAGLLPEAAAQQAFIARLRKLKANGRIVLELPAELGLSVAALPDLALEDGDRFIVPARPSMVSVVGAVYNENAFIFRQDKQLTDYLRQAGGVSKYGDTGDVYVLKADGTVVSKRQSGWLMSSFEGGKVMPGDTIVVPEEVDRTTWTKVLKDYGQILYQFGLGAAALKVIRQ